METNQSKNSTQTEQLNPSDVLNSMSDPSFQINAQAQIDSAKRNVILEHIESSNAAQEKYLRKQLRMSRISAISSVLILVVVIAIVIILLPQVIKTFDNVNQIMADLNVVTSELASADFDKMLSGVDNLITTSGTGIEQAIAKINEIDIDSLNSAIQNLNDSVEPFANFFGIFR